MMNLRIMMFAAARDLSGKREITLVVREGATVTVILEEIIRQYPALQPVKGSLRLAVNQRFADPGLVVREADELAVLPPLGGG